MTTGLSGLYQGRRQVQLAYEGTEALNMLEGVFGRGALFGVSTFKAVRSSGVGSNRIVSLSMPIGATQRALLSVTFAFEEAESVLPWRLVQL
jgi:hypothetical protein